MKDDITNFSAISHFVSDCFRYFGADVSEIGSDSYLVYQLLSFASEICDKYND